MGKRALSVDEILKYKPEVLDFTGRWYDSFGKPELSGCWLIYGGSGNGKTRFVLQLCKYLTRFGKVTYDSLEEGLSKSFQTGIIAVNMIETGGKFTLLDKEPIPELIERLKKRKSADIVAIDSVQYSGLNKDSAKKLVDMFPKKLFLFISHSEGRVPAGRTANAIKFHANVKLFIEGYMIQHPVSRYAEGICKPFTIWEEGANKYWSENID